MAWLKREVDTDQYLYSFTRPWRIVIPALLFNFCLTIIMLYATYNMEKGYSRFSEDLISLFVQISERRVSELHNKYVYFVLQIILCIFNFINSSVEGNAMSYRIM